MEREEYCIQLNQCRYESRLLGVKHVRTGMHMRLLQKVSWDLPCLGESKALLGTLRPWGPHSLPG